MSNLGQKKRHFLKTVSKISSSKGELLFRHTQIVTYKLQNLQFYIHMLSTECFSPSKILLRVKILCDKFQFSSFFERK